LVTFSAKLINDCRATGETVIGAWPGFSESSQPARASFKEPSSEPHLFEQAPLSAGNHNFRAGLESNQKSTTDPRFNVFDILQVDNIVTVGTKEDGRVKALLHVVETPRHHGTAHPEMCTRAMAFRFDQHQVGDSNDPATLTLLDENALGARDLSGSRVPYFGRWIELPQYKRQ
jgi:hypothetical protein